jgi:NADH:ubiquinone oxidoreductase subunit E
MVLTENEKQFLDELIEDSSSLDSPVLFILHRLQDEYRMIKAEHAQYISQSLKRPLNEIYAAATFYEEYTIEPTGKHVIKICCGIVCHSRSSKEVLDAVVNHLGLEKDGTTEDGLFTVHSGSCIGQCDGAPAMIIDGEVYRDLDPSSAIAIIGKIKSEDD